MTDPGPEQQHAAAATEHQPRSASPSLPSQFSHSSLFQLRSQHPVPCHAPPTASASCQRGAPNLTPAVLPCVTPHAGGSGWKLWPRQPPVPRCFACTSTNNVGAVGSAPSSPLPLRHPTKQYVRPGVQHCCSPSDSTTHTIPGCSTFRARADKARLPLACSCVGPQLQAFGMPCQSSACHNPQLGKFARVLKPIDDVQQSGPSMMYNNKPLRTDREARQREGPGAAARRRARCD